MAYDSYAVRYRPSNLKGFRGQPGVVSELEGMFRSRNVVRKMLISGPTGTGKTTLARIIAATLNCESRKEIAGFAIGQPCGACATCRDIRTGSCGDVHEIDCADARKIDDVRRMKESAMYAPRRDMRVFILDEVHAITGDAMRTLLKVLEEPPPDTLFILVTSEPQALPHEIRNRLTHLKLKLLSKAAVAKLIQRVASKEGHELDPAIIEAIAMASRGHARDALVTLESVINRGAGAADVESIAVEILGESTSKLAEDWLLACYTGKTLIALDVLKRVIDGPQFLEEVMSLHETTYRLTFGEQDLQHERWFKSGYGAMIDAYREQDPQHERWFKATEDVREKGANWFKSGYGAMIDAYRDLRSYPPPNLRAVLGCLTLRIGI